MWIENHEEHQRWSCSLPSIKSEHWLERREVQTRGYQNIHLCSHTLEHVRTYIHMHTHIHTHSHSQSQSHSLSHSWSRGYS